MSDRVLLTGVSGFLGGHVALQLLNAGYTVRGSVRNLSKADKVKATLSRAGADISRLEFVTLDLLSDSGWDQAMTDCRFLLHTASPFFVETPKDPQELIRPAVEGTERAINAALKAGIERIVLTSSTAAVQYGHGDDKLSMTEADWTNLSSNHATAYARSKTLAERRAWELMQAAGRHDDLAVINPSVILGPLLDDDEGSSSVLIKRLLDGKLPATPRFTFSIVDVRDVAALHVDALTNPAAAGQRCIAAAGMLSMSELGQAIKPAFPGRRIPTRNLPDWLVRIVALFDSDIAGAVNELGKPQRVVGSRGPLRLGRALINPVDAAIATGNSLIEHHLV
ncbi:aldehyde reductase [Devosia sp.]|uniref:SDR family oxidoreductase n=1 Tax=Devosia sp. TaxID=1871048 RepID=UPI003264E7A9